jgi:hypothetical protein
MCVWLVQKEAINVLYREMLQAPRETPSRKTIHVLEGP